MSFLLSVANVMNFSIGWCLFLPQEAAEAFDSVGVVGSILTIWFFSASNGDVPYEKYSMAGRCRLLNDNLSVEMGMLLCMFTILFQFETDFFAQPRQHSIGGFDCLVVVLGTLLSPKFFDQPAASELSLKRNGVVLNKNKHPVLALAKELGQKGPT